MSGIINFAQPGVGSFLVKVIIWLVEVSSSIAAGIIIFTLILKLITLPFDFVSRASMRKNSLKMEEMRPELERLQKQYADNKELYNQKMMALYKKNGYSMFGACLPTILTLIIFIVAINAFTDYSQYQNKLDFYHMSQSYNSVMYYGIEDDGKYILRNEDGSLIFNDQKLYDSLENSEIEIPENINVKKEVGEGFSYLSVTTDNGYVEYRRYYSKKEDKIEWSSSREYHVIEDAKNNANLVKNEQNNNLLNAKGQTFEQAITALEEGKTLTFDAFINDIQSLMAAKTYRAEKSSFLWIKNIWVTDSPTKHPIETNWNTFKQTHEYSKKGEDIGQEKYNLLIKHLDKEKTEPNGYFILVFLTAGLSLLSQIVMSKSQKAQMELQTVDGQGAQTQKMMTWMMPIMMAIFAFMYTSAFSIYIILSTLISMLSTFAINFIVDRKYKKESEQKETGIVRGRIYTPKEEEKKEVMKEKNVSETGDFLSGKADGKKHVRGRIK